MSRGLICDQCDATLRVDSRGDDEDGETGAWLHLSTTFGEFDLCTRACAVALIESDEFAKHVDACLQTIAEIAGVIRDHREGDDDDA